MPTVIPWHFIWAAAEWSFLGEADLSSVTQQRLDRISVGLGGS